jgi:DNA-binding transcriptional MocR family regulator
MDTYLPSEISRVLATSIPRVQRAIRRLGLIGRRGHDGRMRFSGEDVSRLRDELGVTPPASGFSLIEVRVLAALSRAPLGIASIRALAGRAGVSPTAASQAAQRLVERGLVLREDRMLAGGSAQMMTVMRVNVLADEWPRLAPVLALVVAPRRQPKQARRVPHHLRHLFWNTDRSQLEVANAGGYIARRLLSAGDFEGLAWGAMNLSAGDWEHAATARGLDPDRRALARNIAEQAPSRNAS